jgi:hypothetical protein
MQLGSASATARIRKTDMPRLTNSGLRALLVVASVEAQGSCSAGQFFTGYTPVPAAWTVAVNVNASTDGSLEKTGGGTGYEAGAISMQEISSSSTTPQGVSFKCGAGSNVYVGLAHTSLSRLPEGPPRDIEFAVLCLGSGSLYVYESGSQKGYFGTWTATDVLKVQVVGTTIQYLENDQLFYTSSQTPTFPLHVDTALDRVGNTITDVTIYSTSTGSTCSACPGGKYSASSATSCSTCPNGKYSTPSSTAASDCKDCLAGQYHATTGATCVACPAGKYKAAAGVNTACDECGGGQYQGDMQQTGCIACTNGKYLTAWSSDISNDNVSDCKDCPAGQFVATTGAATCSACLAGKFTPMAGQNTVCSICPSGKYHDGTDETSGREYEGCIKCPSGKYQLLEGADGCDACPAGKHQSLEGFADSCDECTAGKHQPLAAARVCVPCSVGQFTASTGNQACTPCPFGTFTEGAGDITCTTCPQGKLALSALPRTSCDAAACASNTTMCGAAEPFNTTASAASSS